MKIEIFSKDDCAYCNSAKLFLENNDKQYINYMLDTHYTREDLVAQFPQARQFPVIVIDNEYIGGYNELKQYFADN